MLDRESGEAWQGKGEGLKALHRDAEADQAFVKARDLDNLGYTKNDF
jgi:hypothetical protein